jgi:hypothetical protein
MKHLAIPCLAIALLVGGVLAQSDEPATRGGAPPRDQAWLEQLVGEWDVTFRTYMQPDEPPMESEGTDSVRKLGEHWIIAETRTSMMGSPYHGVLSLGYNALTERFGGTWIDSFGGQLWVYTATLDEAGDTMTLETEGPSLEHGPEQTARYRETLRITGDDSRTFTSTTEMDDGTWVKIVDIEYRRKT